MNLFENLVDVNGGAFPFAMAAFTVTDFLVNLEAVFFDPLFGSSSLGGSEGGMTGTW